MKPRSFSSMSSFSKFVATKIDSIVISIFVIVLAGMSIFFFMKKSDTSLENRPNEESVQENTKTISPDISALGAGQSVAVASPDTKKYTHSTIGFSFIYPVSLTISSFGSVYDASGETVLLQDKGKNGIQVLITPFNEDITLTASRIHKDIPSIEMTEVKTLTVGGSNSNVQAVAFKSNNSLMGKSREVWFVKDKRLYQISASIEIGEAFDKLISSWKF